MRLLIVNIRPDWHYLVRIDHGVTNIVMGFDMVKIHCRRLDRHDHLG